MMKIYDISIIVPIYNVEKYIEKCTITLLEQDFDSIEYIFVNDCTPDNSMQILQSVIEKYPNRKDDIKIINKPQNKGLGQARKTGFENATGEYILHIDSDDWVELDMVSSLYKKAKEDDADIVVCDFYKDYKDKINVINYAIPNSKFELLEAFATNPSYMNYMWNKLVKKALYKEDTLLKERIDMTEDLYVMFKLFFQAKKIVQLNRPLVHYNQQNVSSIMNSYKLKYFNDKIFVTNSIIKFLQDNRVELEYKNLINFYKLYSKLVLILYPNIRNEKLWKETYPEANKFVWKTKLKFRYKILTWLASKNLFKFAYFIADIKKYLK